MGLSSILFLRSFALLALSVRPFPPALPCHSTLFIWQTSSLRILCPNQMHSDGTPRYPALHIVTMRFNTMMARSASHEEGQERATTAAKRGTLSVSLLTRSGCPLYCPVPRAQCPMPKCHSCSVTE
mmetsp:Transcript_110014/g.190565  ORF Transcript_110014/g.190565 Transcript_110014/m.190565 type:complete len:126 (-) Transcript_110014:317-694(-)